MSARQRLRVGIAPYSQMDPSCLVKYSTGVHNCEPGMELEILSVIASLLNATLQLKIMSGNYGCGALTENGTWTGLLGLLERDEIDITGNLCTIEEQRVREPSFEPSWPVLQHRQGFLIKKPKVEYKFDITAPFQTSLWITVIVVGLAFTVLAYVVTRYLVFVGSDISHSEVAWIIFRYLGDALNGHDSPNPKPRLLWIMWSLCLFFCCGIYSAYITVAMLNPVVKYRPFTNQIELADSLLRGDYKLLDYHKKKSTVPQCYHNSTCEKFRLALNRHNYVIAGGNGTHGNSFLGELVAPDSGNLVVVNTHYWLESYAHHFDARRANLWLIDDELSGEQWFSYFRKRGAAFGREFDKILVRLDGFKYHVPETYLGMARHIFRGKRFRGDLPETYRIDFKLFSGPGKCYIVGMILAAITLAVEKVHHRTSFHGVPTRKNTETFLI